MTLKISRTIESNGHGLVGFGYNGKKQFYEQIFESK